MNKLANLVSKDPKLVKILDAPMLSPADKSAIVAELEKTSGSSETVKNFLQTLAENNRLSLLGPVCARFSELMSASRGEVEMTVTSATVRCYVPPRDGKICTRSIRQYG
jgi:F-type H+-transporting ATPase subunit O